MDAIKDFINFISQPVISFTALMAIFFFIFPPNDWFMKWNKKLNINAVWTNRGGVWLHTIVIGGYFLAALDPNFKLIVTKPDNVPIAILLFSSVFFLWLSMKQATENDALLDAGKNPNEYEDPKTRKVLVWPDLLYIETIAAVLCMAFLIFWSLFLNAPLEQPADPTLSPNPAKAPWYFLALQEMLVYFDPWLAGVVFPTVIIVGLMAIPYIDSDRSTSGYYSFKNRKLFISLFLFGWLVLWVYMIIVGTFMRGPNWNFFGPFEAWDVHKVAVLNNLNLSELIYVQWLGQPLPENIIIREAFGIFGLLFYLVALPGIFARTWLSNFAARMGVTKYSWFMFLSLMALGLPIKMLLRWSLNLKYLVSIPGWFNI